MHHVAFGLLKTRMRAKGIHGLKSTNHLPQQLVQSIIKLRGFQLKQKSFFEVFGSHARRF